ncbi:MAG: hypothetical protein K0S09_1376 [Sphingobacteriaceae bacterium]|jgi:hypothetical protein|nr:hypothetical protein [Sphingobacteriaceae bacterium]
MFKKFYLVNMQFGKNSRGILLFKFNWLFDGYILPWPLKQLFKFFVCFDRLVCGCGTFNDIFVHLNLITWINIRILPRA